MHWLSDRLGVERLLNAKVILPTDEYSAEVDNGEPADVPAVWQRIRRDFQVNAASLPFELSEDALRSLGQTATDGCSTSTHRCGGSTCDSDPQELPAKIIQHATATILVRNGFLKADDVTLAPLAELMSVFLGFGVFSANTALRRRALPDRVIGYGLALFAWVRDEPRPGWVTHLRHEPAVMVRGGLRFLRRRGDSLFQTTTARSSFTALSVNELAAQLRSGSPSTKIAAMWGLVEKGPDGAAALPLITECLRSSRPDLRAEAAMALGALDASGEAIPSLADALEDPVELVRTSAATALGSMTSQVDQVVPELAQALQDDCRAVVREAAAALMRLGPQAEAAAPALLRALRNSLVSCDDRTAAVLVAALEKTADDPRAAIASHLAEEDADLRHAAFDLLDQLGLASERDATPPADRHSSR
jgi:hypothetical protein